MTKNASYHCLDLTKLIMAVLVIGAHTGLFANCPNPYVAEAGNSLLQMSVFYFFLCTGFFLEKKSGAFPSPKSREVIRGNLLKTVKLYVLWSAIYAPLALVYFVTSGYSPVSAIASYLCGFFLVGQNYNSWMLWYLLSCIYALVFLLVLQKRGLSLERSTLLGGVVYLLGLLLTEFIRYGGELPGLVELIRSLLAKTVNSGRIFAGFFFLPMGMLLARNPKSAATGTVLFLCGFLGDFLLDGMTGSLFRGLCAMGTFVLAAGIRLNDSPVYSVLRKISTTLYFTHMYVWTFYYTLVYREKTFGLDSFLATTGICLLLGYLSVLRSRRQTAPRTAS